MNNWQIDKSWTLFLDRDGVINKRKFGGYITSVEEFEFLPGVVEAIAAFSQHFQHIFVVTNQQGIGKELMTKCNLEAIHNYMLQEVEKHGGKIAKCYFAPELKTTESKMRKPNIGMGLAAKKKFPNIDFSKSIMVGDTDSDIQFGINLGMRTVRIKTEEPIAVESDGMVDNLAELKALWNL